MTSPDIIDILAGLAPGAALRAARPAARLNAQKSFEALFLDPAPDLMAREERLAIALFVAGLHADAPSMQLYGEMLRDQAAAGLRAAIDEAVTAGRTEGPYGAFPEGPLSVEDTPGPVFSANPAGLGDRLAAAFDHAHLLVYHPRDARRDAIEKLAAAGWSADDIVTLSQLVSFLCFQIRAGAGLRVLAAAQ
ncbi:MAG: CMD domain protein [Pararhodobacter sp.]